MPHPLLAAASSPTSFMHQSLSKSGCCCCVQPNTIQLGHPNCAVCHNRRERYKQLRERERQLEEYYSMGSSFGKPTPLLMLPLTEQLMGKLDNQLLW